MAKKLEIFLYGRGCCRPVVTVLVSHKIVLVGEDEGGNIGREYGCVDDQQQNDPVPNGLEG